MKLGDRVKLERERRGFSQDELARRAEVSRQYISLLERNERENPASQELLRIAKALNTTSEYLLTGDDQMRVPEISNLDPELRDIFYELIENPRQSTYYRKNGKIDGEGLKSVLEYIRFTKTLAKERQNNKRLR